METLNLISELGFELWLPMDEDSHIFISSLGNVINLNTFTYPVLSSDGRGYLRLRFQKNKKRYNYKVHRLVAQLFIPNPENKPFVDHIDGNKENNCVSNLRWSTPSENTKFAYELGLVGKRKYLTQEERTEILQTCTDLSTRELMERYHVGKDQILRLRKRGY